MRYHLPDGPYDPTQRALTRKMVFKQMDYMKENTAKSRFRWKWGCRDVDFGTTGNVQAVLTFSNCDEDNSQPDGEEQA